MSDSLSPAATWHSYMPTLSTWPAPPNGTLQAALFGAGTYSSNDTTATKPTTLSESLPVGNLAALPGSLPHPFAMLDSLTRTSVPVMVLSFSCVWAVVQLFVCLFDVLQHRSSRKGNRRSLKEALIVSTNTTSSVHGVSSAALGAITWLYTNPQCKLIPTDWIVLVVASTAGYLILHTLVMLFCMAFSIKSYEPMMFIHHFFVITWLSKGLEMNWGVWLACTMLFNEASSLFVNRFEMMLKKGMKGTRAFLINGLLLTFTFFVCRVLFIPVSMYQYVVELDMCSSGNEMGVWHYGPLVGYLVLSVLNTLWFYRLFMGALSQLRKAIASNKKTKVT